MDRKDFLKLIAVTPLLISPAEAKTPTISKSIFDYGPKGDGKADDTQAFEKALKESDVIRLPGGSFVVGNLVLDGKTLIGPGTLKKRSGAKHCLVLRGANNHISQIEFSTQGSGQRPESEILLDESLVFATINHCRFTGRAFTSISCGINSEADLDFKSQKIREKVIIQSNHFSGSYVHHIYLHVCQELSILSNFFERSEFDSIRLRQLVKKCTISNNFFTEIGKSKSTDSKDAIDCYWSGNELIVSNNHFSDIATHGLDIKGHSPDMDYGSSRIQIHSNQIRRAGWNGILISAGAKTKQGWKPIKNVDISHNMIEGCGSSSPNPNEAGIFLRHCQENVQIHSNQVINNLNKGIMVGNFETDATSSRNISIQSNLVLNNGRSGQKESYGIHVAGGENIIVSQNIIENNSNEANAFQTIGLVIESYKSFPLMNFLAANNLSHGHLIKEEKVSAQK